MYKSNIRHFIITNVPKIQQNILAHLLYTSCWMNTISCQYFSIFCSWFCITKWMKIIVFFVILSILFGSVWKSANIHINACFSSHDSWHTHKPKLKAKQFGMEFFECIEKALVSLSGLSTIYSCRNFLRTVCNSYFSVVFWIVLFLIRSNIFCFSFASHLCIVLLWSQGSVHQAISHCIEWIDAGWFFLFSPLNCSYFLLVISNLSIFCFFLFIGMFKITLNCFLVLISQFSFTFVWLRIRTQSDSPFLFAMLIAYRVFLITYLLFTTKTHSYSKFFAIRHRMLTPHFFSSLSYFRRSASDCEQLCNCISPWCCFLECEFTHRCSS